MKKINLILCLFLFVNILDAQSFSVLTWNIQDLGRSKNTEELDAIADLLKSYDLVAIQEVVAKDPAGARAVALLADRLNRTGTQWDYRVSLPTQSPSSHISERYAYLWKTAKLQLIGRAYLDAELAEICHREPYIAAFKVRGSQQQFHCISMHARTHNKAPEKELVHFSDYPKRLNTDAILILGDFNLQETHKVWQPLYAKGFAPAISKSPTTLKRKCSSTGEYLNHAIDNIYYNKVELERLAAGRIDFVRDCTSLPEARLISDHLPVYLEVHWR